MIEFEHIGGVMKQKKDNAKDNSNLLELLKLAAMQNEPIAVKGKLEGDPLAMGLYNINGKLVWLRLELVTNARENLEELRKKRKKGEIMKKIKRDPYFENILEQAAKSGGPLVVYNGDDGNPKDGLYLLNGNRTMTLPIKEVERKKAELENSSESEM